MLAIFHQSFAHPPEELHSPVGHRNTASSPDQILRDFTAVHPSTSLSATFSGGVAFAAVPSASAFPRPRLFCSLHNVYCTFVGRIDNLGSLIRQYGLCRTADESLLVIEAYRTFRDRGPYPADQVVKDLVGSFAFVLYDNTTGTVFTALSADAKIPLYWGIASDGSVVICDDLSVTKNGCGKSYAPFPPGCLFHSAGGLRSFEHPMNVVKAMPRVDSEGVMCGANFKVDKFTRITSMPRVGSMATLATWE